MGIDIVKLLGKTLTDMVVEIIEGEVVVIFIVLFPGLLKKTVKTFEPLVIIPEVFPFMLLSLSVSSTAASP